jgi:hypothetical protein
MGWNKLHGDELHNLYSPLHILRVITSRNTMQRIEPLLCDDSEISKYTRAVTRQQLDKHIPAAKDANTTMVQQQRDCVFCGPFGGRC